jgi:gamma-glutamyltranspeptidase / glutathione hydrolase
VSLAPFSTRFAADGVLCTVDALAAAAGSQALRSGGCAADAAIAAGAVLAVTHQHLCGLGGDLMALVHRRGEPLPCALNASGRAGSGADPERLRAAGFDRMPTEGDVACVPVPGCVDGWLALHQRFARLPLEELLEPARRHAAEGFAASQSMAAATRLLGGVPGTDDYTAAGPLRPGQLVRRLGVARLLAAIARDGRRGFYEGEFGQELLELGGGEYSGDDLARPHADWVPALGIDALGHRLWSPPPNSQGYVLLRSAAIASELKLPEPEHPDWAHLLIEASREAAADRGSVWHERSDGPSLIAPEAVEAMRARVSARHRQSPAASPIPGGTVSLCVVDRERMAVSMLQSNFVGWGSMLFTPGSGVALQNRGSSFSLIAGHPAEYAPRRRPPHTLTPALLTSADGQLVSALATRGGEIQPQVLLQLLARTQLASQTPGEAIAAGRWVWSPDQVLVEGHAPARWLSGLTSRGHRVGQAAAFADQFGHAQLIVSAGDHLAAASDPRSDTWAVTPV